MSIVGWGILPTGPVKKSHSLDAKKRNFSNGCVFSASIGNRPGKGAKKSGSVDSDIIIR